MMYPALLSAASMNRWKSPPLHVESVTLETRKSEKGPKGDGDTDVMYVSIVERG